MRRLMAGLALAVAVPIAGLAASAEEQVCSNRTGTHGGYFFTFWKDGGDACITLGEGGAYRTAYRLSPRYNLVTGKGWAKGSASRVVGYNAGQFDPGNNSYLTLYGWSTDPLVEYYVVDSWGTGFRPPGRDGERLGTVESDGGTYEIFRSQRVEKPSIRGAQTFYQYWSVRTERRPLARNSTITFANHVAAWRQHGLELGTMDYQVMATEGFGSDGASNLTVWQQ